MSREPYEDVSEETVSFAGDTVDRKTKVAGVRLLC